MVQDIQVYRCASGLWLRSNCFSGQIKKAYADNEAFDVHPTSNHKERDSKPGQLTGMCLSVKEEIFFSQYGQHNNPKSIISKGNEKAALQRVSRDVYISKRHWEGWAEIPAKMYERFVERLLPQD